MVGANLQIMHPRERLISGAQTRSLGTAGAQKGHLTPAETSTWVLRCLGSPANPKPPEPDCFPRVAQREQLDRRRWAVSAGERAYWCSPQVPPRPKLQAFAAVARLLRGRSCWSRCLHSSQLLIRQRGQARSPAAGQRIRTARCKSSTQPGRKLSLATPQWNLQTC